MLSQINASLARRPISGHFVSIAYAVWNDKSRKLQIASSGLPRPIFVRDGRLEIVEATGLPLGLFPEAKYDTLNYQAQPGDVFVFFSDGLIDASNRAGELFGRAGVEQAVAKHQHRSAEEIADRVFSAVAAHSKGVAAFDDQTIVVLKVQ